MYISLPFIPTHLCKRVLVIRFVFNFYLSCSILSYYNLFYLYIYNVSTLDVTLPIM